MGAFLTRILGAVGAALLSVTMLGAGVASADPLNGQSYDDAAAKITGWRGTPVVSTVSGNQLAKGDCIVTSWHKSTFRDASGDNTRPNDYLLSLNCNNYVAAPGKPGNSAMTPEGIKAKKDLTAAESIDKNPAWCQTSEKRLEWCEAICASTGRCEV
ncbi:hypothetical protein [Mycolicibacterium arenosum]|uniref:Secreted protein n=1 Tax=Mycolicibacterium arenosum TaxID=2952157 RepID=A0ABT1M7Y7_9MYCO|nr:hypothetical protein [Mycolicibacterium sp. CAU 1645]MCP9275291.1 hypothetical protein [Mycolicibacterium sp. CAU 1645]